MLYFMPLAGLIIGITACYFPHIMGNGRSLSQLVFSAYSLPHAAASSNITIILLILAVIKMLATLLVLRCGASGGVLQPSISTGACVGVILYAIFSSAFGISQVSAIPQVSAISQVSAIPQVSGISQVSAISVAIIGAASLLASSRKAPIMAWLLVAELVNAPFALLILMLFAVIVSNFVANCVERFISHSCFTVTRTR